METSHESFEDLRFSEGQLRVEVDSEEALQKCRIDLGNGKFYSSIKKSDLAAIRTILFSDLSEFYTNQE